MFDYYVECYNDMKEELIKMQENIKIIFESAEMISFSETDDFIIEDSIINGDI